jgi:hypothetical protein
MTPAQQIAQMLRGIAQVLDPTDRACAPPVSISYMDATVLPGASYELQIVPSKKGRVN